MLRKIADFVKKIFRMEPIPTTVNTLREALQALEVARNHFEHCDPEFVDALTMTKWKVLRICMVC